jgi:hypothetical protein
MIQQSNTPTISKNILVDIDALLDTRLPLIYTVSQDVAAKVATDESYLNRVKDNFPAIPGKVFELLYKRRNKGILLNAAPTYIFYYIDMYLKDIEAPAIVDNDKLKLFLNFYPYTDLLEEEKELFTKLIASMYPKLEIVPVSLNNFELTPIWLVDNNVELFFKYNGLDWLDCNFTTGNLFKQPLINRSTLILPALVKYNIPTSAVTKETFKTLTVAMSNLVDMVFIDALYFSAQLLGTINAPEEEKENNTESK